MVEFIENYWQSNPEVEYQKLLSLLGGPASQISPVLKKYKISNNKITSKIDISGIIIKGFIDKNSINKERRVFSGFGSAQIIDRQGDYLPIAEFKPVMEKLMARGAPVTDSHSNHVVGRIVDYTYKPTETGELGLYLTAEIYNHYPSDDETWRKIQEGEYTGFSLGGKAGTKTPQCSHIGCYNILGDIEAWEFSIVERPANQLANIDKVNKLAKSDTNIKSYIIKDGFIIQKPFAGYKDFAQRVAENKDKGDPNAYCGAIKHKVEKRADFTLEDVKRIGNQLGIDWTKIDQNEFLIGLNIELEHGIKFPETNITDDDEIMTAKITLAHINEFPDYYNEQNGLPEMEKRLKGIKKGRVYVDNPQDAPKDKKVQEGERGGLYYESEGNTKTTDNPKIKDKEYFNQLEQEIKDYKSKNPYFDDERNNWLYDNDDLREKSTKNLSDEISDLSHKLNLNLKPYPKEIDNKKEELNRYLRMRQLMEELRGRFK